MGYSAQAVSNFAREASKGWSGHILPCRNPVYRGCVLVGGVERW